MPNLLTDLKRASFRSSFFYISVTIEVLAQRLNY